MKSYTEKRFSKECLEKVDIQNVGVYYNVPIENIIEEKRAEFDLWLYGRNGNWWFYWRFDEL